MDTSACAIIRITSTARSQNEDRELVFNTYFTIKLLIVLLGRRYVVYIHVKRETEHGTTLKSASEALVHACDRPPYFRFTVPLRAHA